MFQCVYKHSQNQLIRFLVHGSTFVIQRTHIEQVKRGQLCPGIYGITSTEVAINDSAEA